MGDYLSIPAHEIQFIFDNILYFQAIFGDFMLKSCYFWGFYAQIMLFLGKSGNFLSTIMHEMQFILPHFGLFSLKIRDLEHIFDKICSFLGNSWDFRQIIVDHASPIYILNMYFRANNCPFGQLFVIFLRIFSIF